MKIPVPTFILKNEDPNIRLFVAYMYRIASIHGFRNMYNIDARDARILSKSFFADIQTSIGRDFWPNMIIGQPNNYDILFRFRRTPHVEMIDFTDPRCNLVWGYLIARENEWNGNLLTDEVFDTNSPRKGRLGREELRPFGIFKERGSKNTHDLQNDD